MLKPSKSGTVRCSTRSLLCRDDDEEDDDEDGPAMVGSARWTGRCGCVWMFLCGHKNGVTPPRRSPALSARDCMWFQRYSVTHRSLMSPVTHTSATTTATTEKKYRRWLASLGGGTGMDTGREMVRPVLFPFAGLLVLLLLLSSRHYYAISMAVVVSSSSIAARHSSRQAGWRVRAPLHRRAATTNDETTAVSDDDDDDDGCSRSSTANRSTTTTARRFKILTCRATACAAQRERWGLDEFATYAALSVRANPSGVPVEETSCLGACQQGPCVAVSHDEYEGNVALEGMTTTEFANRVFFRIGNDDDADRVWACVEDAIHVMSDEEQENEPDGNNDDEEEDDDGDVAANDRYV
jgi:hypothetical protein